MKDELLLTSLISSRICHDLISPIGAINNGLELLALTGAADGEVVELISASAQSAADSLKFLRIAYGAASVTEMMRSTEIASVISAHLTTQRLTIKWAAPHSDISRATVKVILLMAQVGATAAPLGGVLKIEETAVGGFPYSIGLTGTKIGFDPEAAGALGGDIMLDAVEPRYAPLALLSHLAKDMNVGVDWTTDGAEGRLRLG